MRVTQFLLATHKETPADAETISHQLMLRSGMIRKLGSGLYTWLPLGLRVLKKLEAIVRDEMNRAGALEVLMPAVQPAELWQETGRWQTFGPLLLKIRDRAQREFCFGPTHEEVITDIVRKEIKSYKQLPINYYQIQTKFRDEIRPRFGVMRAREFIMKDAYSFHLDVASLEQTYQVMYETYCNIFNRVGLQYRAVLADTGSIGGSKSHEFQVLADSGEDIICYSDTSDYAANLELAEAVTLTPPTAAMLPLQQVATPQQKTITQICDSLQVSAIDTIKTLVVKGKNDTLVALILRGDHELNPLKAEKHPLIDSPLTFASDTEILEQLACPVGYLGPIGLRLPIIADRSAAVLINFVCGANAPEQHFLNANWQRDAQYTDIADLRNVVAGDPSPDKVGTLKLCRGIEVGHIFQLGDKYSCAMHATVLNQEGKLTLMTMGCYGLGVSRVVAAAIEQNHDQQGIIWPESIAPFEIALIAINLHKSLKLQQAATALYHQLVAQGYDVLFDDRDERPGTKFADMDLIGIPHHLVLGERNFANGMGGI